MGYHVPHDRSILLLNMIAIPSWLGKALSPGVAAGAAEPSKAAPGPCPGRGWVPWAAGHSGEVFWRAGGAGSPEP